MGCQNSSGGTAVKKTIDEEVSSIWGEFSSSDDCVGMAPLKEPKRRRMSISTINGPETMGATEKSHLQLMKKYTETNQLNAKKSQTLLTPGIQAAKERRASVAEAIREHSVPGITGCVRTEPILRGDMELVKGGELRIGGEGDYESAYKSLFPDATMYAVFGGERFESQSGFDNKEPVLLAKMPDGMKLEELGIGFACRKGLKLESPNQDNFCILRIDDWSLYGVFDGHGPYGHYIAAFVHRCLPYSIVSHPDLFTDVCEAIRFGFAETAESIRRMGDWNRTFKESNEDGFWDDQLSGCTATICIVKDGTVTMGHVGDSRAICAKSSAKTLKKVKGHAITQDHKANLRVEKQRIEECGGEVRKLEGDVPHRVFVAGEQWPGLAMSRTLGDLVAQMVGVSCVPDIKSYPFTEKDYFLVIASDGVWEFMSNDSVVNLAQEQGFLGCQAAADAIALKSWEKWIQEEDNTVDDITCLVLWNERCVRTELGMPIHD